MSPPRRPKNGINFRTWWKSEAQRAVANYKKRISPSSGSHTAPKTAASLARLRTRARRAVANFQNYDKTVIERNIARVTKMLKEVANYEARRRHKLVINPNKSYSLARRN